MRLTLLVIVILFSCCSKLYGQLYLSGIVRYENQPVSQVTVYIASSSTVTDNLGRYILRLDGCKYCILGNTIQINTKHIVLGSNQHSCVIGSNFQCDLILVKNSANISVAGIVKSDDNAKFLAGVEVKPIGLSDIDIQSVKTNLFGEFGFSISKSIVGNNQQLRFQVRDSSGIYRPKFIEPQLYDLDSFIIISMVRKKVEQIKVGVEKVFSMLFSEGDIITIDVGGEISTNVIRKFGTNGPEGRDPILTGHDLRPYSIAPEINHGALMYKLSDDVEWKYLGKHTSVLMNKGGYLEFQINANKPEKIKGAFSVNISY